MWLRFRSVPPVRKVVKVISPPGLSFHHHDCGFLGPLFFSTPPIGEPLPRHPASGTAVTGHGREGRVRFPSLLLSLLERIPQGEGESRTVMTLFQWVAQCSAFKGGQK